MAVPPTAPTQHEWRVDGFFGPVGTHFMQMCVPSGEKLPTLKPRVTVTFPPHIHETIHRLAQLQGRSRGAVVIDLLEACHPPLMRTVALMEAALEAPNEVRSGLRKTVEELEEDLQKTLASSLKQVELFGVGGGWGPQADEADNPRPSNTGVRSSRKRAKRGPK